MGESSSSSDEEVKEKLRSAVWDVKQPQRSLPLEVKETKNTRKQSTALPPSLRASKSDPDFNEEIGVVQASPELKSFVAKKLTRYLDGVITEYAPNQDKPRSAECEDDFKLFSTSKHCDPATEVSSMTRRNQQHAKNKRRTQDSSSDSDSDEEQQKLASVAVSFNDVIHAQSILSAVAETKPPELIISDGNIANKSISNGNNNSNAMDNKPDESSKKQKKKKRKQVKLENSDDEKCRTHVPLKCKEETDGSDSVEYEHINSNKNEDTSTLGIKKHKKKKKKNRKNDTNL